MESMIKNYIIYVDPAYNALYATFYLKGLYELFGKENIRYSNKPFMNLRYDSESHVFAFVINEKKYAIDFADSNNIFYTKFLEWADVYGKVNYNEKYVPRWYNAKIVKCGCNFGVGMTDNKFVAAWDAFRKWLMCRNRLDYNWRIFLSRHIMSSKRKKQICDIAEKNNYIFFVSTLWWGQKKVNQSRINFIRACKQLEAQGLIRFEGGLVPDAEQDTAGIEDVLMTERIPYNEYVRKVQESYISFNTPAYFDCHGWKLPEYISMGKVILSTPFVNELPQPLKHKENIYFTTDHSVESIKSALLELIEDKEIYANVKRGVKQYWQEYMCDKKSIEHLIYDN